MKGRYNSIKDAFKEAIDASFGDFVKYSFLTGSINYIPEHIFRAKSDVDLLVLLSDDILKSGETKERRTYFNDRYKQIHQDFDLKPDYVFPGEVISESMLTEVKEGRGFEKNKDRLTYKKITGKNQEWLDNPDLEFRCWRSMYFFTKNKGLIIGDRDQFNKDREEVILPLLMYLTQESNIIKNYEDIHRELRTKLINSNINELGYSQKYNNSFLNGAISEIPIIEALSQVGIYKDEKIDQKQLETARKKFNKNLQSKVYKFDSNPFIV